MEIIPVIDIQAGLVVRARRGERSSYRPIDTPLSPGSDPLDVAKGLLALHPFRSLYVADLDGIERQQPSWAVLERLAAELPHLALWTDFGCSDAAAAADYLARVPGGVLVIGTESQDDEGVLRRLRDHPRVALSIDYFGDDFRGPRAILDDASLWPGRVIVMTLGRVGGGEGPDVGKLSAIAARAGARRIHAAGGIRGEDDCRRLQAAGIAGALVASALHDGALGAAALKRISGTDG
ncbi:HisA/HisF-related TIM barrel protein [Faunimonas sp. B44]|uniref:HisA/HisF-related TIM barrel protein n=1 Tax=Faunimonas sp. B44 TaxID=3461493 RepID=UPI0040447772